MLEKAEGLIREWEMLPRGCTVVCAVSGGADSMCLLHWLSGREGIALHAAHFNHKLRGEEADRDAAFVQNWCEGAGVPFHLGSGDVASEAKSRGLGIEEAARELRYAFLRETARAIGADRIATAHTAGDNAETVLMHLIRGTGLRGLTGIPPRAGEVVRPLLTTTRQEVEDYLRTRGVPHVEDSTNRDDSYLRNKVRRQLIPLLEEWNPGFVRRMTQTVPRLREDDECLNRLARQIFQQAERAEGELVIPASALAGAPDPIAARTARLLLGEANGGDPDCSAAHLRAILDLCRSSSPSGEVRLPRNLTARREYDRLIFSRGEPDGPPEEISLALPGETAAGPWRFVCTHEVYQGQPQGPWEFWLDREAVPELTLRPRRPGDRLRLAGRPQKTVKKWMIEEKLPRRERDGLPLLDLGGQTAAAAGLGPEAALAPREGRPAWHILIRKRTKSGKEGTGDDGE